MYPAIRPARQQRRAIAAEVQTPHAAKRGGAVVEVNLWSRGVRVGDALHQQARPPRDIILISFHIQTRVYYLPVNTPAVHFPNTQASVGEPCDDDVVANVRSRDDVFPSRRFIYFFTALNFTSSATTHTSIHVEFREGCAHVGGQVTRQRFIGCLPTKFRQPLAL